MKKRILSCLMALALCLTLLPAAALAAETAPGRVTLAWVLLESGKSYVPKEGGGIKEKTDQSDANYLTYADGVLTVHGTVAVNCNNGDGLSFYDGVLTLAGDGDLTITASSGGAVSGSPGSTLTTAEGFSGSITLRSENRSAVQNVKLELTTEGDIQISSAKSNAVNTPQNPVTLKGETVTIETTADSPVSVSTVVAPSLNVTAGSDVTIIGNGGSYPLIAGDSGKECAVTLTGQVAAERRAPGGMEVRLTGLEVLSRPAQPMPVPVSKGRLKLNLDTELGLRPVVLRALKERAVFKIQEGLSRAFREYLTGQGFTEVHTPKIVHAGAEGGSNIFRLDYFGRKAFLAQSPQFYKQTMVGVFQRVFEVAPVFRAEKHSTPRHLNEYTSLDFEMGFIRSFQDVMDMEAGFLQYAMALLERDYADDLALLGVTLPETDKIPAVRFDEAKRLAAEKYGRPIRDPYDLEPEEEHNIGRYFKEEYGADFVFVTHYPAKKRPFYAMDDPEDSKYTLSFDLLFRGMEVTTGGQRIHDYAQQVAKMEAKGMDPAEFDSYLMIHKHGMPPHGGLGIGLERLTAQLCGLDNVRRASLFPRDLSRLEP